MFTREQIEQIDKDYESIEVRANRIWQEFQSKMPMANQYDMLCFCVCYIALLVPALPSFEEPAKKLNSLLYLSHYLTYANQSKSGDSGEATGGQQDSNSTGTIQESNTSEGSSDAAK